VRQTDGGRGIPYERILRDKRHERSPWFELACLLEQAEFELRCGLRGPAAAIGGGRPISRKLRGGKEARSRPLSLDAAKQREQVPWKAGNDCSGIDTCLPGLRATNST
jgi:hypothetical protein